MAAVGSEYAGSLGKGGRALRMWRECRREIGGRGANGAGGRGVKPLPQFGAGRAWRRTQEAGGVALKTAFMRATKAGGGRTGRPSLSMKACKVLPVARRVSPLKSAYSRWMRSVGFSRMVVTSVSVSS